MIKNLNILSGSCDYNYRRGRGGDDGNSVRELTQTRLLLSFSFQKLLWSHHVGYHELCCLEVVEVRVCWSDSKRWLISVL